jgi:hypothetical protein
MHVHTASITRLDLGPQPDFHRATRAPQHPDIAASVPPRQVGPPTSVPTGRAGLTSPSGCLPVAPAVTPQAGRCGQASCHQLLRLTYRGTILSENQSEGMVKIRIEGTQECQQARPQLAELFDVVSVSDLYPNRGRSRLVRVYLDIRLDHQRQAGQDATSVRRPRATIRRTGRELPRLNAAAS